MKSVTCPDSVDEDEELTKLDGSDRQSDKVEALEIYTLTCLTVQR